jgi:hypothetical protein
MASSANPPRRQYAKDMAVVFERRPEVRVAICTALRRLCVQNKLVLKAHGQQVSVGQRARPEPGCARGLRPVVSARARGLQLAGAGWC